MTFEVLPKSDVGLLTTGWRNAMDGGVFGVFNPATGEKIATVADAGLTDAEEALEASIAAQGRWSSRSTDVRAEVLRRAYDLILRNKRAIASLITLENGKTYAEAEAEVDFSADYFRWYSEEVHRMYGRISDAPHGRDEIQVRFEPVGPVYVVTPWNFPLAMASRKIAPAIAAGCSIIVKPASETPLTALRLCELLLEAGAPEGLITALPTSQPKEISEYLLGSDGLRKISFTGSTPVGRSLFRLAADNFVRMSLELGGNAPLIVFEDADLPDAAAAVAGAKMRLSGQTCIAPNRILVHENVREAFVELLTEEVSRFRLGEGLSEESTHGPLINRGAVSRSHDMVDDAMANGGKVLYESPLPGHGSFFPLTVISGITPNARMWKEEIFAPIAPVYSFASDSEAIRMANDTKYGLASYVFTGSLDRSRFMVKSLACGMVGVNQAAVTNASAPFGGIRHSGLGREGGPEGLMEYLDMKYIATKNRI